MSKAASYIIFVFNYKALGKMELKNKDGTENGFLKRLAYVINKAGGNEKAAQIMNKSVKSVERYKSGAEPTFEAIAALAYSTGISLDWLVGQDEEGFNDKDQDPFEIKKSFTPIPMVNIPASAGGGSLVLKEEQAGIIAFQEKYLRSTWFVNPEELFCMPVTGESMEPTIHSGEFLLVSKAEQHIKPSDGIFVVRLEENIMVKRLQPLPGSKMKISSDNKAYEPFVIELNDGVDFAILGKVLLVNGLRRV